MDVGFEQDIIRIQRRGKILWFGNWNTVAETEEGETLIDVFVKEDDPLVQKLVDQGFHVMIK